MATIPPSQSGKAVQAEVALLVGAQGSRKGALLRKKLERLSSALGNLLQAHGMSGRLSEYRILGQWPKMVGELVAAHTRPVSVRGSKLYLAVDSPAWMQQLSLLKPDVIEKVNRGLSKQNAIKDIVLKLGEVTTEQRNAPPPSLKYHLTADDQAKIEGVLADVSDHEIRDAIRRVMEKDLLRKKEKRT